MVTAPATAGANGILTVSVVNANLRVGDWVGLAPVGAPNSTYLSWMYLNGSTTAPAAGLGVATLHFTAPAAPGNYELRLFANGGYTRLATSGAVAVTAPLPATVTPSSATINPGSGLHRHGRERSRPSG